ncbi:hypothetical protein BU16DRAFT_591651 [Lophium mytilinum]|uniref:Uncharacterized protein n=1 Tax=Lophium mytilinum TaxID=390894 RepID=A0A6A6QMR0_9PEZI|nr:hypothetical protein BU16DRAFT_591651 [Lophium mytilinum]
MAASDFPTEHRGREQSLLHQQETEFDALAPSGDPRSMSRESYLVDRMETRAANDPSPDVIQRKSPKPVREPIRGQPAPDEVASSTRYQNSRRQRSNILHIYALPNGQRIDYDPYGVLMNVSTSNLTWAEDLLTPEFAEDARWALANITILTLSAAGCGQVPVTSKYAISSNELATNSTARAMAVTCAIYPCMRSYTPSITNNKLSEPQGDSSRMLPTYPQVTPDYWVNFPPFSNVLDNANFDYFGLQSPCHINDLIYTTQNMSSAPNTTTLYFYDAIHNRSSSLRNVSAPEQCIYRHSAGLGSILASQFQSSIFQGQLSEYLFSLGINTGIGGLNKRLSAVWNDGNATFEAVDGYLDKFAVAMTNQYRCWSGQLLGIGGFAMFSRRRFRGIDGASLDSGYSDELSTPVVLGAEKKAKKLLETEEIRKTASKVLSTQERSCLCAFCFPTQCGFPYCACLMASECSDDSTPRS